MQCGRPSNVDIQVLPSSIMQSLSHAAVRAAQKGNWMYPIRPVGIYISLRGSDEWASANLGAGPDGHVFRQKGLCTLELVQPRADLWQGY